VIYLLIGYMWLFIHRPFEVWPVLGTIRFEMVYVILTCCYWLFFYPKKTWVSNWLNMAFGFFWVVFLLAWQVSPFQEYLRCSLTVENYFKTAVFYVLVMASVRDEKQLKTLTMGFLVVFAIYMTHSLREFYNGRHEFRMGIVRMIGIDESTRDPNTFASSILYSLGLTLAFWREEGDRKQRLFLTYFTGLSVLCIILTGSRSGFIGIICFLLFCFRQLFRKKILLLLVLLSVPLGWSVMPLELQNRFWTLIDPSVGPANARESAEGRTRGFYDGVSLWEQSPLLGFGPGAHGMAMGHGFQAHNLYGQVLGETGTLGALALLGIVVCFFANALVIRGLRRRESTNRGSFPASVSGSVVFTIVLLLIKGNSDHNLYRYTWLWNGAFQAIAVSCMRKRFNEDTLLPTNAIGLEEEGITGKCDHLYR
jgi:O-antigen ligase